MPAPLHRAGVAGACALFALPLAAIAAAAGRRAPRRGRHRKSSVAIVDLGAKRVVARPDVGLRLARVALTCDGLRAAVVSSDSPQGRLTVIDLVTKGSRARSRCRPARAASPSRPTARAPTSPRAARTAGDGRRHAHVRDGVGRDPRVEAPGRDRGHRRTARAPSCTCGRRKLRSSTCAAGRSSRKMRVGKRPVDLAVSALADRAYVSNAGSRSVSVVDAFRRAGPRTFKVRRRIGGIAALARRRGRGRRPGPGSRKAVVIKTSTGRRVKRIAAGTGPGDVEMSTGGGRIYTASGAPARSASPAPTPTASCPAPEGRAAGSWRGRSSRALG